MATFQILGVSIENMNVFGFDVDVLEEVVPPEESKEDKRERER
jgi:hypothetical protein